MQIERPGLFYLISPRHLIKFGMLVCSKLKAYNVVGPILSILESFLREHSLKVVLDGQSSPLCITNAGVPQGSVLGTTLFLVFNELSDEVLSRIGIYFSRIASCVYFFCQTFFES